MLQYSPEELALFVQARNGDPEGAATTLESMRPGLTRPRFVLLRGKIRVAASVDSRTAVLNEYISAMKEAQNDPYTYMLILVQGSVYAYMGQRIQEMRELLLWYYQTDVLFPGHEAVEYWSGSFLVNYGNHLVRLCDFQQALDVLDAAVPRLHPDSPHWCHLVRTHYLRSWCLVEMGRLSEAREAIRHVGEHDQDDTHIADHYLGQSRIALACQNMGQARACATIAYQCALAQPEPDWQIAVESKFQQLIISLRTGVGDARAVANEVVTLASKHGIQYIIRLVKLAVQQYAYGRKEGTL